MPNSLQIMKSLAFVLVLSCTSSVCYAQSSNWVYKGQKDWKTLTGKAIPVDYAEKSVSDDTLAVIYDKRKRQWYIQFTYISDKTLFHTDSKEPEIFVRTRKVNGNGRFDSDYVITRKATVYYNDPGKPQFVIMEIEPEDLRYIKVGLDLGVGYYLKRNCVSMIEGKPCIELGEFRTYLFAGTNIEQAITKIERSNDLTVTRPFSKEDREQQFAEQKANEKTAEIIKWYHGDWAEVTPNGPRFGGCDGWRDIDFEPIDKLFQKGQFTGGKHKGILAISSFGNSAHDHIYVSSAYPHLDLGNSLIVPVMTKSDTKKIPLFVESGQQFMHLRLGTEIPGIPYKRIIETNGKVLRLVAWDTGGKEVSPLFFMRCED